MKLKNIIVHMFRKKYERDIDAPNFKSYFYRFIGTDENSEYDDILKTLQSKCEEYKDSCLMFDGSIPLTGEMELIQYINNELQSMNIYDMKNQDITIFEDRMINYKFLNALDKVIPIAIDNEKFFNESIRNNFITKLIVWSFLWVKNLEFDSEILNKCIYYGGIQRHEIYFLMLLHNMNFDVIYLNPLKEEFWSSIDTGSELVQGMGILNVETFSEKASRGKVIENYETITKMLQRDIEKEMFTGTGIYRPWQFRDGYTKSILLDTILEDIYVYWNEPAKLRPSFNVEDDIVRVPCMFYKIDGVYSDNIQYQKLVKFCIESENTVFINNRSVFSRIGQVEEIYQIMFCQLSDGAFDIEEIKKLSIYKYSKYSKEVQNLILNKFNELITSNDVYIDKFTKEDALKVLILVLGLNEEIVRIIDNFDFTGKVPKVVIFIDKEDKLDENIQIILGYFHIIGIDIVVFNPSGMVNLNEVLKEEIVNKDRLDTMKYEVRYSELIKLKHGMFSRFLGK